MFEVMSSAAPKLRRALTSRRGQSLVEYTLVLSFVSLVGVAMMGTMGGELHRLYSSLATALAFIEGVI